MNDRFTILNDDRFTILNDDRFTILDISHLYSKLEFVVRNIYNRNLFLEKIFHHDSICFVYFYFYISLSQNRLEIKLSK